MCVRGNCLLRLFADLLDNDVCKSIELNYADGSKYQYLINAHRKIEN